ncbi:MAG: hypothetical protein R3B46_15325 [Phycisphaerales bacterium]
MRPGASGGSFDVLTPRAIINPAPAAQHANTADELTNPIWNESGSTITAGSGLARVLINRDSPIASNEYFQGTRPKPPVSLECTSPARRVPSRSTDMSRTGLSVRTYYNEASQEWGLVNSNATVVLKATSQNDIEIENNIHADAFKYHELSSGMFRYPENLFFSRLLTSASDQHFS